MERLGRAIPRLRDCEGSSERARALSEFQRRNEKVETILLTADSPAAGGLRLPVGEAVSFPTQTRDASTVPYRGANFDELANLITDNQ